ncbi:MAG: pentatricopeptide repeat-containing protein [Elusimicrobiota bacterium]
MRGWSMILLSALGFVPVHGAGAYDLGGPCAYLAIGEDRLSSDIREAEKKGDWVGAVELQRRFVRNQCDIEYRWHSLVDVLIKAGKRAEAVDILDEMDRRGFEIKPSRMESEGSQRFLSTPEFAGSDAGKRIRKKLDAVGSRRREFQKKASRIPAGERPPTEYVAKGVCPFECCTYRTWDVLEDTELLDSPNGKKVVGKAVKGGAVDGLMGEVHLEPRPMAVVFDNPPFVKGDIFFLLDPMGEGFSHYWLKGKVGEAEISSDEYCLQPGDSCWAEDVFPDKQEKEQSWWIKIRLRDGSEGWTDKAENFGNMDSCS